MLFDILVTFLGLRNFYQTDYVCSLFSYFNGHKTENSGRFSQVRDITRQLYLMEHGLELSPAQGYQRLSTTINKIEKPRPVKEYILQFINNIYTIFIFGVLLWSPIYTLIHVNEDMYLYLSMFFLQSIIPIVYLDAIIYFNKDHFEKFIHSSKDCVINIHSSMVIVLVVSVLDIIYNMIAMNTFGSDEFINFKDSTNKPLINIAMFITFLYSRLFIFLYIACFTLVFLKHQFIVKDYTDTLGTMNLSKPDIKINEIERKITDIRYELEESIENFKNSFSVITLFGTVSVGLLIEDFKINQDVLRFPWERLVRYFIIQMIMFMSVWVYNYYRDELLDFIKTPNFVHRFLERYDGDRAIQKFKGDKILILVNMCEENACSIDWMILNRHLSEPWTEFSVMGIPIGDGDLIKRGIALVTILLLLSSYFT